VKKIRAGGVGNWGQVPMPPNTTVSEKEAQVLAKWILSQK
jgi:cytochrome c